LSDTSSIAGDYFASTSTRTETSEVRSEPTLPEFEHRSLADRRRAVRHRRLQLPGVRLVLLVTVAGFALWGTSTPGGVPARLDDFWRWVQGGVERATVDPQLKRIETSLDAWFARSGSYPDRAEFDPATPGDPGGDGIELPVGVAISFCGPRHVVVSALTSRGTVSRLLVDGARVGDVEGNPGCPLDPDAPAPW
jgi:hypothetical protein